MYEEQDANINKKCLWPSLIVKQTTVEEDDSQGQQKQQQDQ